jgi:hypothetical protein
MDLMTCYLIDPHLAGIRPMNAILVADRTFPYIAHELDMALDSAGLPYRISTGRRDQLWLGRGTYEGRAAKEVTDGDSEEYVSIGSKPYDSLGALQLTVSEKLALVTVTPQEPYAAIWLTFSTSDVEFRILNRTLVRRTPFIAEIVGAAFTLTLFQFGLHSAENGRVIKSRSKELASVFPNCGSPRS